jgi:hypothetical protein
MEKMDDTGRRKKRMKRKTEGGKREKRKEVLLTRRKAGSEVDTAAAGVDRRLLLPTRLPVPVVHQLAVEHGTAGRAAQVCRRVAATARVT